MYERMLNKNELPTEAEFIAYCGETAELFHSLDSFLMGFCTEKTLRFPYGNKYGWGEKYAIDKKHFCDVFAEKGSFTCMLRILNTQLETVYDKLTDNGKELADNKYPCGEGGYIHYRVTDKDSLSDVIVLLGAKRSKK